MVYHHDINYSNPEIKKILSQILGNKEFLSLSIFYSQNLTIYKRNDIFRILLKSLQASYFTYLYKFRIRLSRKQVILYFFIIHIDDLHDALCYISDFNTYSCIL